MRFASKQIRQQLNQGGITDLHDLKYTTKSKYRKALHFMEEWTQDLTDRQNDLERSKQQFYAHMMGSLSTNTENSSQNRLDIQRLIKEEFCKNIESLYLKQEIMARMSKEQLEKGFRSSKADPEDSLNRQSCSQTFRSCSSKDPEFSQTDRLQYSNNSSMNCQ